jgi:uncharacterized protein
MITVEVVYALPLDQQICTLEVPDGTTVGQAIALSGRAQDALLDCTVARRGRPVALDTVLRDRDRIEILRPLRVDPKEARRRRQLHRSGRRKSG